MNWSLSLRQPRRGVTLLELLVVLVLMALSALVVLPALSPPAPTAGPDAARAGVIASARRAAIRRGELVRVRVDTDGVWAMVATRDGATIDGGRLPVRGQRGSADAETPIDLAIDALGTCRPAAGANKASAAAGALDALNCRWPTSSDPAAR